jgi:hypothetical protein
MWMAFCSPLSLPRTVFPSTAITEHGLTPSLKYPRVQEKNILQTSDGLPDGIGAEYAIGEGQILPQPILVNLTEKDHIFHAFHPADRGDNVEEQYIHQIMLFTAVDPGIRASSLRMSMFPLHPVPIVFFLEGFYNAVALF